MRTNFIYSAITQGQDLLIEGAKNYYNRSEGDFQCLLAIPTVVLPAIVLDVAMETVKAPLNVIQQAAFTAINLLGLLFSKQCTIRDTLFSADFMLKCAVLTPISLLMAVPKLIYQLGAVTSAIIGMKTPLSISSLYIQ